MDLNIGQLSYKTERRKPRKDKPTTKGILFSLVGFFFSFFFFLCMCVCVFSLQLRKIK